MSGGRPTKYDPAYCDHVVDFPKVSVSRSGNVFIERAPKLGREAEWCLDLMGRYSAWHDLVDMKPAIKISIECAIGPEGKRAQGLCRADAIVWHSDNECSIVEAKTDCAPGAIAGGIGQLLYYRSLITAYWGVKVDALLLAAPQLPPLILESIADATAPIRFLKKDTAGNLSGLVPRYG